MSIKKFYQPGQEKTFELDSTAPVEARKQILLVDDDATFATITRMLLLEHGFDVETAADGVQGIRAILARDYDVILCDMVMPTMPGDMFYLGVERVKPHLCKRFLFLTGHQGDRKIDEFIRRIRGLALFKPFQTHVLIEAIQAVLDKAGSH